MGAYHDFIQCTVLLILAMIGTLLNGAPDLLIGFTTTHKFLPPFIFTRLLFTRRDYLILLRRGKLDVYFL